MACLDVKTMAVYSGKLTFCWRNSLDESPSTLMNGRNMNSTSNFSAMSKYGDFSLVGLGCDTKIFLIIGVLKIYFQIITHHVHKAPKCGEWHYFKGTKVQNILQKKAFSVKKDKIGLEKCERFN